MSSDLFLPPTLVMRHIAAVLLLTACDTNVTPQDAQDAATQDAATQDAASSTHDAATADASTQDATTSDASAPDANDASLDSSVPDGDVAPAAASYAACDTAERTFSACLRGGTAVEQCVDAQGFESVQECCRNFDPRYEYCSTINTSADAQWCNVANSMFEDCPMRNAECRRALLSDEDAAQCCEFLDGEYTYCSSDVYPPVLADRCNAHRRTFDTCLLRPGASREACAALLEHKANIRPCCELDASMPFCVAATPDPRWCEVIDEQMRLCLAQPGFSVDACRRQLEIQASETTACCGASTQYVFCQ